MSRSDLATSYDLPRVRKQLEANGEFLLLPIEAQEGIAQGIFASMASFVTLSQAAHWKGQPLSATFDLSKPRLQIEIAELKKMAWIRSVAALIGGAAISNLLHLVNGPWLFTTFWPFCVACVLAFQMWRTDKARRKAKQ